MCIAFNSCPVVAFSAVVSVEPTISYYEKVSEELEKILHEVKEKDEQDTMSDGKDAGYCFHNVACSLGALGSTVERFTYLTTQQIEGSETLVPVPVC